MPREEWFGSVRKQTAQEIPKIETRAQKSVAVDCQRRISCYLRSRRGNRETKVRNTSLLSSGVHIPSKANIHGTLRHTLAYGSPRAGGCLSAITHSATSTLYTDEFEIFSFKDIGSAAICGQDIQKDDVCSYLSGFGKAITF